MELNFIDLRTVIVLAGVMSGLMSMVLYALKRSYPVSIKGLGEWSAALLLVFMGTMLAAGQGRLPVVIAISLARLMIVSGLYLTYVGTQRFFGVEPHLRPWLALIAGVMLLQAWFTYVDPSYHVRLVLANLLAGSLFAMYARLMLIQKTGTFAGALTLGVSITMSAIQFLRLVTSFIWPVGDSIFETLPQHLIYVASFAFCVLLLSVSLVLMATERLRAELEHLAMHDSLTNAMTRRHMNEACWAELERCRRHGRKMALLMMDLDLFKAVNDTYGHQAGDQVLVNFVRTVNALLRGPDRLGRFGGEEFMVLLPDTSQDEAELVAERIRAACAVLGQKPACTVSIGVTTNKKDSDTMDTLLARADAAMYRAKTNGRNRIETA